MKKKLIFYLLCFVLLFTITSYASQESDQEMYQKIFTQSEENIEQLFTQSFLDQIPVSNLIQIINNYKNKLGMLKEVKKSSDGYTLIFEKGSAPSVINVTQDKKIAGIWFGNISLNEDDFDKILNEFKQLNSDISICIMRENNEEILTFNENKKMAVGSTFKLYVLKALNNEINTSDKEWTDIVKIKKDNISLPTGIIQDWPVGSPLTVSSLAKLMIYISDNTATDHLIDYIGRDNIEQLVDGSNIPFLKTSEFFKLKHGTNVEIQNEYINGDIETKRKILNEIKNIEVNVTNISDNPVFINQMEWFFSTKELCQIIYELKDSEEIKMNPGLASKDNWYMIGYKGGSEAGVLQFTHLLQKTDGSPIYAVSVTANNNNENINVNKVSELATRLISQLNKNIK